MKNVFLKRQLPFFFALLYMQATIFCGKSKYQLWLLHIFLL